MATEKKEDFNLVIHHYVHYDKPEAYILEKFTEIIKILNNHSKKINNIMATQQEIINLVGSLVADNQAHLALSVKIDADVVRLEQAINNGLDGNAIMAALQTLKGNSLALTAALQATDDKTPEGTTPPVTAQFTADIDLWTDSDGSLTDVDTGTPAFTAGQPYNVVSENPLVLAGIDGNHDVTDYEDSFTAV